MDVVGVRNHLDNGLYSQISNVRKGFLGRKLGTRSFQGQMQDAKGPVALISFAEEQISLSWREIQCIYFLLAGCTIRLTGEMMFLSPRTIEFYLNNIKRKLMCRRKDEVMVKIMQSDFADWLRVNMIV